MDSSTAKTELAQASVCISVAADLYFPSGHLRLHDSSGTFQIGGNDFVGDGRFVLSSSLDEGIELVARPLRLVLSGVDAEIITTVRAADYQGRAAVVYLAVLDGKTLQPVAEPQEVWEGYMDTAKVTLGNQSAAVELTLEHILRNTPQAARYTDVDQQRLHTGDLFFNQVSKIAGFVGKWGDESQYIGSGRPKYGGNRRRVPNEYES
jgi:hypothetical protein